MKHNLHTGLAVPLGALRSKNSCGVGEFADLALLADFCEKAELSVIQLLPVNDTGTESSPYSALSAFALHPLYIRLQDIPEASNFSKKIKALQSEYASCDRFPYTELCEKKTEILRAIYDTQCDVIMNSVELNAWIKKNPWIEVYAVFAEQKRLNHKASWKEWKTLQNPTKKDISDAWNNTKQRSQHLFFAWVQMHLDSQFAKASAYVKSKNIILKGDIPIMMNEDSCDAWAYPEYFDHHLRAGSPSDDANPLGQNWGFPIYNWENLKKDGYSWWKNRLHHAALYYQAYRIDHVLGFFRIWATSTGDYTAALGHTRPNAPITGEELAALGFSGDRRSWISEPHVPTKHIEAVYNNDYLGTHGILQTVMDRIGNEELWVFKKNIHGEKDIYAAPNLSDKVKDTLAESWRDRMLVCTAPNCYVPMWTWYNSSAWKSLSSNEQEAIRHLFNEKKAYEERLWEAQARELLGELTRSTDMIPCAEDLGANPDCLEKVLNDLQIYGLRVVRWWRDWKKDGSPYIPFEYYSPLTVSTASVHDSSTMRGWWIDEQGAPDFLAAFPPCKADGDIRADQYTPHTARYLLSTMAHTKSHFFIPALQDWLELSAEFYSKSAQDTRINIPGSVTSFNWTYRIEKTLEDIVKNTSLIQEIQAISAKRKRSDN